MNQDDDEAYLYASSLKATDLIHPVEDAPLDVKLAAGDINHPPKEGNPMQEDYHRRFSYHKPGTAEVATSHQQVRDEAHRMALLFTELVPQGRERSVAITKIEEAMMWANAGIARAGGSEDPSRVDPFLAQDGHGGYYPISAEFHSANYEEVNQ